MHIHAHTHMRIHIHVDIDAHTHAHIHIQKYTCTHTHTYTHTYIHTNTHTHTHTQHIQVSNVWYNHSGSPNLQGATNMDVRDPATGKCINVSIVDIKLAKTWWGCANVTVQLKKKIVLF